MMTQAQPQVLFSEDPKACGTEAHHRDFPEIRAHGRSKGDALEHLTNQLVRTLDSALTAWRREALEKAIADVRSFDQATT
jgi:hypothetical protein